MSDTERVSRQDLVVPPRQSSLPLILGACICGCLGFGLVWGLGIGRVGRSPIAPAVGDAVPGDSAELPPPGDWRRAAIDPDEQPETDRYPETPVSYQRADAPGDGEPRSLSRFSKPDAPDPSMDDVRTTAFGSDEPPADTAPPAELAAEDAQSLAITPPVGDGPLSPPPTAADLPPASNQLPAPPREPEPEPRGLAEPAVPPAFQPTTDLDAPAAPDASSPRMPPSVADASGIATPQRGEPIVEEPAVTVADPFARPVPAPQALPAATPRNPEATVSPPTSAALTAAAAAVPVPAGQGNPAASVPLGFGPQALTGGASPLLPRNPAPPSPAIREPDPLASASGQGRPGPPQLEGVQAPQITVEKRGPREVQVGKPARYEMSIRNVGTATAHAVMLHDAIPAGTRLVATTPPAAPAADDPGGLVWVLGTLDPGAGTKVAMEVMPEAEGEIGSVASVTFRADVTARSRSTRPGLQIEAPPPEAVLVGGEITASIAVSNPGTGVSTGVVLVGTLPDGVTHPAGREVEFDVGRLEPGARRTIDLTLGTTSPGVHAMTILARADGQLHTEAAVPLEVTAPMLELAADMPGRRYLQRPATCLITMHNTGTAPAKAVELATQLPPGLKFVRANNAGFYDERHHRVLWSLEELPAGETGTVELVVMPVDLGPQKLVTAARNPAGLSDQIANTIEVEGLASLTFLITDSEDPIEVGGLSEYVIRVGNQGTKPASGVRVAATLLGDLEPVDAKGPAGHRIENLTVYFEPLAKLVPTEETTYRIRIRGRRAGDHRVQVQVTSDDHPAPITKEEVTRVYADR